ncbi:MAG: AI-2E family transporter, partial [Cyanobacteria bacterium J06649_11]
LQHGGELWQSLVGWLPTKFRNPFSETVRLSFQNFFITQLILSICMASALIPTFLWLKVPFGLLFGLTIGIMALIPFGGSVGIALTTSLVALQDFWIGMKALMAAVIVQQILENIIAPRILGSFTGLNPVWVLISVLTGARIGGLLGVIVAVPSAVVIKTALDALRPAISNNGKDDVTLELEQAEDSYQKQAKDANSDKSVPSVDVAAPKTSPPTA